MGSQSSKGKIRGYDPASGRVDHRASWYDARGGRSTPFMMMRIAMVLMLWVQL